MTRPSARVALLASVAFALFGALPAAAQPSGAPPLPSPGASTPPTVTARPASEPNAGAPASSSARSSPSSSSSPPSPSSSIAPSAGPAPTPPPASSAGTLPTPSAVTPPTPSAVTPPGPARPPPDDAGARASATAVVWPTLTPAGDGSNAAAPHLPTEKDGSIAERARALDALLADTAQDLGLTLDVGQRPHDVRKGLRDHDLVEAAHGTRGWVISPRLERDGGGYLVRIVAVAPGGKVALVRSEYVTPDVLAVRAVVMLRDLVRAGVPAPAPAPSTEPSPDHEPPTAARAHSAGRAVLAVSTATFGGFTGYALQKASRGDDPRLLYPLMALGTGIGLGGSLIIADEWDVGTGDAWYLAAGTWWPTAAAFLLAEGYNVEPTSDRYAYALLGSLGGVGLSSLALSQKGIGEGAALLTHSGALFGSFVGGGVDFVVRGTTDVTPYRGLGYGAAAGVLVAGAAATQVQIAPSRVLLIDLGAGLGALAGAAVASPLLLSREATPTRERAWSAVTLGSTVAGAGVGVWLTRRPRPEAPSPSTALATRLLPTPSIVAVSQAPGRAPTPAFGAQWYGSW